MEDVNAFSIRFVQGYYQLIGSDPKQLANLYNNESVLIYGGDKFQGAEQILDVLTNFPLKGSSYNITSWHVIPAERINGVLISVVGTLKLPGRENALVFSQTFCLKFSESAADGFWVDADIFRLEYA